MSALISGTMLSAGHGVAKDQYEPGIAEQDQAHVHHVDLLLTNVSINTRLGLTERFGVGLFVPMRSINISASFEGANGELLPNFNSIHHRTELLAGLGDMRLSAHVRLVQPEVPGEWVVDLRLGTTLPTGGIEEDPFKLGRRGQTHQHMFFGNGTFDPALGLQASTILGEWTVQGFAGARLPLYKNGFGYRGPRSFNGGVGLSRALGTTGVGIIGQVAGFHETPATWSGADARNSGRTDLIGVVGASYPLTDKIVIIGQIRMPWVLQTLGGNLSLSPTIVLGAATRLPVWDPPPPAPVTEMAP